MSEIDQEFERKWAEWLVERNRRGARIALWLIVVLYPLFGVLDYLIAPREWLWLLYSSRAVVTACTLVMFALLPRQLFARHCTSLTSLYIVLAGFGIAVMIAVMGGFNSPYYAGLNLVMLGAGVLFLWPARVAALTHLTIVASFLLPNALTATRDQVLHGVTNLFFLGATAAAIIVAQTFIYRAQRDQVFGELSLARTKLNLERAHEQLKQLDAFKSQFFANITHELKTPLALILSPLELMLQGELGAFTSAQQATLQSLFRHGMKLLKMIGDLLDLSKLEESRLRLKIGEHDLVDYVRTLVAQIKPLTQRKSLQVSFVTNVDRAQVWYDHERMERVIVNLLSNAAKFTPPGGHIWVSFDDQGDSVRLVVKDDGPGFPSEMAARVFERFFQVDMAGTRKYGGTGIGLALAKELVELHGGSITAESAVGEGAAFTLVVPKDREHFRPEVLDRRAGRRRDFVGGKREGDRGVDWAVQLGARDDFRLLDIDEVTEWRVVERDPDERRRAHTVLVVDDTPDVIRIVHLALRQDCMIMAAPNGLKGLELAGRELPSLIITDLMMPEIDGLELTRRLRADPRTRHIPIVMLTARGDLDDKVVGLETGVNAYLAKPFSPRELLTTVRSLLHMQETTADILLTQRMDSLETITGGLAHEINNPLNYLKNALALIRRDAEALLAGKGGAPLDARMKTMLQTAESGVKRIAETVELMGRYSREGFTRVLRPHDVFAAVQDVVGLVLPATGRPVKVETAFEGDGHVPCVPQEMNQVLTNLIQNAIEAAPDDGSGWVRVTGRQEGSQLVLSVKDNGPGIKPEDKEKLFTPFYSTKGPGRGMGLGLTISWRVVNSLGGTITVDSLPGAGTEIVVRLPRPASEARAAGPAGELRV